MRQNPSAQTFARIGVVVLVTSVCIRSSVTYGAPLGTAFTYQGRLKSAGAPLNATADFQFSLWDAAGTGSPPTGGAQIGATQAVTSVAVAGGLFTVQLNAGGEFSAAAFNGDKRWLEITVNGTPLSPRQPLTAAPNALFALNAATAANAIQLNGQAASFYQNAANLSSGTIPDARLAGTYSGALALTNPGNVFFGSGAGLTGLNAGNISQGLLPSAFGGTGLNTSAASPGSLLYTSGVGVWSLLPPGSNTQVLTLSGGVPVWAAGGGGLSLPYSGSASVAYPNAAFKITNAAGGYALWGQSDSALGNARAVYGLSTAATGAVFGGRFESASTSGSGVFGSATAASGTTYGGRFESWSTGGYGVVGLGVAGSGTNYGGWFSSNSTDGVGVFGSASATSGDAAGAFFRSDSTSGTAVKAFANADSGNTYAGYFEAYSPSGHGILGLAAATSGSTYGVSGVTDSTSGTGVFGETNATSGVTYGVYGLVNSPSGRAVYGLANASSGDARGVYGISYSTSGLGTVGYATAGTGTTYGVYGQADSPSGYAVWASGRTGASGTKSFRIDHPDDPENKYLLHYSVESSEVLNAYSGKVTLDGAGQAVVELPHYFAKINKDPRYTLTAVGAPMPMLHVAEEINENSLAQGAKAQPGQAAPLCSFRIAGGAPGAKVSWEVKAVRNDRWMQRGGAPVEVEKQGPEKGTYQHPELYGQPAEKGLNYDATRERAQLERPSLPTASEAPR
jgi:hypothetical protein